MLRTSKRCTPHERIHAEPKAHAKRNADKAPLASGRLPYQSLGERAARDAALARRQCGPNGAASVFVNKKRTFSGPILASPQIGGGFRARAFLFCYNIHSNPQTSFFDLGRCRVQDRRAKSCGRIEVSARSGPAKTTPRVYFKFLSTGLGYISERATFGPDEPQIENGLQPFIEGFNGHRTSHKSLSDSVRQYHFAADRAPARCALLHFEARSSLVDSEEPGHPEAIRRLVEIGLGKQTEI